MQEFNICFSLDSNYVEQFSVSVASILKNSLKDETIKIYILDGGLNSKDKANIEELKKIKDFNIEYLSIDNNDFLDCPMLKDKDEHYKNYHVSKPTYYRFKLPTLLPKLDKILYLDCDVIVRSSLKELFAIDIKNVASLMCFDVESKKEADRLNLQNYFNAGVMLINLDFWRKNNIQNKLFEYAKNNVDKILWQDQDIINCVLNDSIKQISIKWNYQYFLYNSINITELENASIIHLAGRFKPWLMPFEHFLYDVYYEFLELTPFKNKIISYKNNASGKHLKNDIGGVDTNIVLSVFDVDLQKVYRCIDEAYTHTENIKSDILKIASSQGENVYKDIHNLYDEISRSNSSISSLKNYLDQDIDKLKQNINDNVSNIDKNISVSIEVESYKTDKKIHKVYQDFHKVYEEISKIYSLINEIKDNLELKINEEILPNKDLLNEIDNKVEIKNIELNEKIDSIASEQTRQNDLKNSEIYAYTNNELLKVFNQLNANEKNLKEKIELKTNDAYKWIEENKNELNKLKENLNSKLDVEIIEKIENKLISIDENHKREIANIVSNFDEKLNIQRIHYENKLIEMEDFISNFEKKYENKQQNIIAKIITKLKKR